MLSVRLLLSVALLPLSAAATTQVRPSPPLGATPERVAAIADCKGRWFEGAAIVDPATKRGTRIRLCSKPGATDAEWTKTLRDAADQVRRRDMPAEPKAKLLAQIDAAIAKVGQPAAAPPPAAAPQPPVAVTPSPLPVASATAPLSIAAAKPAPSIALTCAERGQPGDSPCGLVGRNSILVVKAVSGMEQGARLRLLRRGEDRAEIRLPAMRPGQTSRAALPEKICAGVNSSKVEFQMLGPTGTTGQRFGPYSLTCR